MRCSPSGRVAAEVARSCGYALRHREKKPRRSRQGEAANPAAVRGPGSPVLGAAAGRPSRHPFCSKAWRPPSGQNARRRGRGVVCGSPTPRGVDAVPEPVAFRRWGTSTPRLPGCRYIDTIQEPLSAGVQMFKAHSAKTIGKIVEMRESGVPSAIPAVAARGPRRSCDPEVGDGRLYSAGGVGHPTASCALHATATRGTSRCCHPQRT